MFPSPSPAEDSPAVIEANESSHSTTSWKVLREKVRICAAAMRAVGVKKDDRVAGYLGNTTSTLVAMLAATSIGALWTAVSPDTGVHAVLDRLKQVEPVILFVDNGVAYNGRVHPTFEKVTQVAADLESLRTLVVFETIPDYAFDLAALQSKVIKANVLMYANFTGSVSADEVLQFASLPPDHPTYILYSSGTTGVPKPIVHGLLGTLIQHKKEHVLHCSIETGSRLFYYSTTTWMMWHWLVSGLASGATIVVYDGSPFRPLDSDGKGEMAMPRLIENLQITHFGTSAKYLSVLEQAQLMPRSHALNPLAMSSLKAVFSTGSPLAPSTFAYVYRAFGPDIMLGSITGGTDIISLFGASCPVLPVYSGEIQCRGLGMAVAVFDHEGNDITAPGEAGDLVCTKPFPCQPVMFWPPGPVGEARYRGSYFERFPGVWHHGDFIRIDPVTGGLAMLGRSDGVLKPAGVRFGSSEIYNIVLKHFGSEISDGLCIGRRREGIDSDETVVLFVKMAEGHTFTVELAAKIREMVKKELSARHVPKIVEECPEIPITTNGKKVETAVKQILCGFSIKTGASVANAECLDWYRDWAKRNP